MKRPVIWLVVAVAACGGSSKPPPAQPEPVENRPVEAEPVEAEAVEAEAPATQPSDAPRPVNPMVCDDYMRMMAACVEHPKFPAAARDATRQALAQMQQAFAGAMNVPEAQAAMANACQQALDAMSQSADAMCPGIFPPAPPKPNPY